MERAQGREIHYLRGRGGAGSQLALRIVPEEKKISLGGVGCRGWSKVVREVNVRGRVGYRVAIYYVVSAVVCVVCVVWCVVRCGV